MSALLLEVNGIVAGYGEGPSVIRDVSLNVGAGEIVALLGANGAGKTTTLRSSCGLLRPRNGRICYLGKPTLNTAPQVLARNGLVHVREGHGVFYGLTVAEHFRLSGASRVRLKQVDSYFPALASLHGRLAGLLSGGEQQMLSLACAIAREPKVLLIDELSLGLAPVIVERLLPIVRRYASDEGAGVLLVEQHVHLALEIADRGYVLANGKVVVDRSALDLRRDTDLLVASYLGESADANTLPSRSRLAGTAQISPGSRKKQEEDG